MERLKELLILVAFMVAIILFPWLAFLMVRFFATLIELDPASIWGNIISIFPNIVMFIIAFVFLKMDDWDFKSIGLNLKRILPGFVFIVLILIGLYIFVPMIMTIFYEPRTLVVSFDQKIVDAFINSNRSVAFLLKNTDAQNYLVNFIRSWLIVGVCEEISARGYMLNKFYSILPDKIWIPLRKIISILFIALFFTLIGFIRSKTAGNQIISPTTLWIIFLYGLLIGYAYVRTNNIYVGIFMQAALDFPPLGLTVNKLFSAADFGFIFSMVCFLLFVILLIETYSIWGKPLEFEKKNAKTPAD